MAVTAEQHKQLVENQLINWRLRMEDWRIASVVAQATGIATETEMAACVKAIEALEKMLIEPIN